MHYITFLLAWRYIRGAQKQSNISIMITICFIGITIGTFSLALILSIMNGFEKATHEKLQGINPQIQLRAYGNELNVPEISSIIDSEFPEVDCYSPTIIKQAILQSTTKSDDTTHVVMVKAIDPKRDIQTTTIASKITQKNIPTDNLSDLLQSNQIIIGEKLAQELDVTPGEELFILYAPVDDFSSSNKIKFEQKVAMVSGIYSTGIEEVDAGLIICSISFVNTIWPDEGVSQINIQLRKGIDEPDTVNKLKKRFNLEVYSWKDLYPALVSALQLEKYAMFFILALITLVASMNIISLLFMHITQKKTDIAILKSLGMTDGTIAQIFMMIGFIIALLGSITGLTLAAIAGLLLQRYPFITLPDVYYVSHLPIALEMHIFILVFFIAIILSCIATWIPVRTTRTIEIATILRFDA
ncbi:MAG TPA: FtsX-like permease family protein [Candidatus Babeliales bacterium]|nr:FtsX-like permease family protein [Candidatus Babeliales bacterium]